MSESSLLLQEENEFMEYSKDSDVTSEESSNSLDEHNNLLSNKVKCHVYWYRWYICLIFSLLGLLQGAVWNTWAPIDDSAEIAYNFSSKEVDMLTNWGPIAFIVSMPIYMWLLDNKGLRISILSTAFLVTLGTAVRCLPFHVSVLRYLIHAGQLLNGIAGCIVMAAPPLLSSVWFPPNERITATGVSTLFNYMGTGVAYILGMIVQTPSNSTKNASCVDSYQLISNNSCHEVEVIRKEIQNILYVECGIATFTFICMLIFFPNRPPLPPSISASMPRMSLKAGLLELSRHRQFWVITVVLSLVIGNWSAWTGVMPIILKPLHIEQNEAGLLGFVMSVSGCLTGMVVGWFTDRLKGRTKLMLSILFSLCLLMFAYLVIISGKWLNFVPFLPRSPEVWTACVVLGICMNAAVPLGMEMAADTAYPVSEGTSTSIVVWLFNFLSFIFLLCLQLTPDPTFANYVFLGCLIVSLPTFILFTVQQNRRLGLDTHPPPEDSESVSSNYGTINVKNNNVRATSENKPIV